MEKYRGREILGREPREIINLKSQHNPEESVSLVYYVKTRQDLVKTAKEIARDETTGSWIGQKAVTSLFRKSQADVYKIEKYGPFEGVIYIRSPLSNLNPEEGLLYQLMMLTIGGPVLEFVYYDEVAFLDFELPSKILSFFPGPQFGISGTRKLLGLGPEELIVGTIVKPCAGLSVEEVAEKCYQAALGGVRFIKDDEKMLGPEYCPQEKKIRLVTEALKRAYDETGQNVLYAPHLIASPDKMRDWAKKAIDWGVTALMFNPLIAGIGCLEMLAQDKEINVPLYAHSGGRSGWSTGPRRVDDVVLAKLLRLAGADYFQIGVMGQEEGHIASLIPELLLRLKEVFTNDWEGIKDTLPVAAGGLNARNLVENIKAFGSSFMGLAGSSILKHPWGIKAGVTAMNQAAQAFKEGIPLEKYAQQYPELKTALQMD